MEKGTSHMFQTLAGIMDESAAPSSYREVSPAWLEPVIAAAVSCYFLTKLSICEKIRSHSQWFELLVTYKDLINNNRKKK